MLLFFIDGYGEDLRVPSSPSRADESTLLLCHFDGKFVPDYARGGSCLKVEADNVKFQDGRFGKGIGGFDLIPPERSGALLAIEMIGKELLANDKLTVDKTGIIESWHSGIRKDGKIFFEGELPMDVSFARRKEFIAVQDIAEPREYSGKELVLKVSFKAEKDSNMFIGMECFPKRPEVTSGFIYQDGVYAEKAARKGRRDDISLYALIPEGTTSIKIFIGGGHFYVPEETGVSVAQASLRELVNFSLKEGSVSLWIQFPFTRPGNCSLFNFLDFWTGPSLAYTRGYGGRFSFNLGRCFDGEIATASICNIDDSFFDGKWHYFRVSWKNINTGKADGELNINIDGTHIGRVAGEYIRCETVVDKLFLGAWSVGGRKIYPAEALLDELKITDRYEEMPKSAE